MLISCKKHFTGTSSLPEDTSRTSQQSEKAPDLKPALVGTTHGIVNALGPANSSPTHTLSVTPQSRASGHVATSQVKLAQFRSQQASSQEVTD